VAAAECAVFAGALRYPLSLVRSVYDSPHYEDDRGETDTSKEVVYTDWQQVTDLRGKSRK
jgi:menaquinone-dependent protoporphyrinogen oxidase